MTQTTEAVTRSVLVPLEPEAAFELFADRFGEWWPKESHHILEGRAAEVVLEPRAGGRWYERTESGEECEWGRVLEVDRPNRIVLAWQLTPEWKFDADESRTTEVDVRFSAEGDGTRVTLEHRGFEVHGEAGAAMRDAVGGDGGWGQLMELYKNAA